MPDIRPNQYPVQPDNNHLIGVSDGNGVVLSAANLYDLGDREWGDLLPLGVLLHEQRDLQRGILITELHLF